MQIQATLPTHAVHTFERVPDSTDNTIQVISDPMALSLEMAEELGFIRAEQRKSAIGGDDESVFKDSVSDLMAKALDAIMKKVSSAELKHQLEDLMRHLPPYANQQQLDQFLSRYGKSSAYKLLLLAEIIRHPKAQGLGYTAQVLRAYANQHEAELTAYINLQPSIAELSLGDGEEKILAYEDAVIHTSSVLEAFSRLNQRYGLEQVEQWRPFLLSALASDLTAVSHSSEPRRLQMLLQEMQHFYIYNSLMQDAEFVNRHVTHQPVLIQEFLDYLLHPSRHYDVIGQKVADKEVQTKILFHQDFRGMVKNITPRAFHSEQQKTSAVLFLQNKIDPLIWSEEAL